MDHSTKTFLKYGELRINISPPVPGWLGLVALGVCGSQSQQQKERPPPVLRTPQDGGERTKELADNLLALR